MVATTAANLGIDVHTGYLSPDACARVSVIMCCVREYLSFHRAREFYFGRRRSKPNFSSKRFSIGLCISVVTINSPRFLVVHQPQKSGLYLRLRKAHIDWYLVERSSLKRPFQDRISEHLLICYCHFHRQHKDIQS